MTIREDLSTLSAEEIEAVEKLTVRWVFQATLDFGMEAHEIFLKSPDDVLSMPDTEYKDDFKTWPTRPIKCSNINYNCGNIDYNGYE